MKLYYVQNDYIHFLNKEGDNRICINEKDGSKRVYFGFLLSINNYTYLIPLSSAKENKDYKTDKVNNKGYESHKLLKPMRTVPVVFITEQRFDGSLHVISKILFSNMFPVSITDCMEININKIEDYKKKSLLQKELNFIRANKKFLTKNFNLIYKLKSSNRNDLGYIRIATVDFKLLESKCDEWNSKK
ncbi:type III toxin-antitoxin system ToxN/AbiQ family toxin [Breznakia pachnodae]|uniref:Protein AbiQ n=1 Tax=Breznakia pachnodae TaxID=265178 RepID=A0ABU0DZQ4_9FIRM|nr:type III toxin-antitoxin system ToxN/AbiQ family toxin [Breznakia pachnodae]MDQ0360115.1 protein AbiQ [Breznakia pachnodae]